MSEPQDHQTELELQLVELKKIIAEMAEEHRQQASSLESTINLMNRFKARTRMLAAEVAELKSTIATMNQERQQTVATDTPTVGDTTPLSTNEQPTVPAVEMERSASAIELDHDPEATALENCRSENTALQLSNDQLKLELDDAKSALSDQRQLAARELSYKNDLKAAHDAISKELKELKYRTLVAEYPVIGVFNGNGQEGSPRYTTVSTTAHFPKNKTATPLGFTSLYLKNFTPMDVGIRVQSVDHESHLVSITAGSTGALDNAGCTWFGVKDNDPDFQSGSHTMHGIVSFAAIVFPRPYAEPPQVVAWLTGINVGLGIRRNVWTFPLKVTATGTEIYITGPVASTDVVTVSWVACRTGKTAVVTGSIRISNLDPCQCGASNTRKTGSVAFNTDDFVLPPRVIIAMNGIDIERRHDLRFALKTLDITTKGMKWQLDYWSTTAPGPVGFSYIALG